MRLGFPLVRSVGYYGVCATAAFGVILPCWSLIRFMGIIAGQGCRLPFLFGGGCMVLSSIVKASPQGGGMPVLSSQVCGLCF